MTLPSRGKRMVAVGELESLERSPAAGIIRPVLLQAASVKPRPFG